MKKIIILSLGWLLAVALLLSCAKDSPTDSSNPAPAAPAVSYGALQVNISGVPGHLSAHVTVSGPGAFSTDISSTTKLDSLPIGAYTVVPSDIVDTTGDTLFVAPPTRQVTVSENKTATAEVVYQQQKYGRLQIIINGLPGSVDADVAVTSPDGNSTWSLAASDILDSLAGGDYQIVVDEVTADDGTVYEPNFNQQMINVVLGQTSQATVTYSPKYGSLQINITGLPPGTDGEVTVTNPDRSQFWSLADSFLIDSLEPGIYQIEAADVTTADDVIYVPDLSTQSGTIEKGLKLIITVKYQQKYGMLQVNITGLPANTDAKVIIYDVARPRQWDLTESTLIDTLLPGSYEAQALEVTSPEGVVYVPEHPRSSIFIEPGITISIPLPYKEKFGKLQVFISGLPAGTDAKVKIIDLARPMHWDVTETMLIDSMLPGSYDAQAFEVTSPGGVVYIPVHPSTSLQIRAGEVLAVPLPYKEKYGNIQLKVSGLPAGLPADIFVRNQDNSLYWNISSTEVINSVPDGLYTILVREVVGLNGDTLKAIPDSMNVNVTGGDTTKVSIKYNGFTLKLFASLHDWALTGSINTYYENTDRRIYTSSYDANLHTPFVADGCTMTAVDVTDVGYEKSISGDLLDGSFEKSQSLVVSMQNRSFELTDYSNLRADVPSTTYSGSIYSLAASSGGPILQIENPNHDSIEITVHWDVTGTATYSGNDISRAGASVHSWLRLYTSTCYTNLMQGTPPTLFNAYLDQYHDDDTAPLSGDTTIVIKNASTYLIWIALMTKSRVDSFQQALNSSHDGAGSGAGEMTVVISVTVDKY